MLKAIIFDFDGVITDTFDLCVQITREHIRPVTKKLFRDSHDGNVYENGVIVFSEKETKKFWRCYRERISHDHLFPVKSQIKNLSEKSKLFIVSSTLGRIIEEYLSRTGMAECFENVLGSDTHESKVEKFKMIFKKHKLAPEDCVFVTDTLGDLREANRVGIPSVAVTWGFHGKTRLKKGRPDVMIHDFEDLTEAVEKLEK